MTFSIEILVLVSLAAVAIAAATKRPTMLSLVTAFMLVMIPLLGQDIINYYGLVVNIGAIFFSAVVFGVTAMTLKYGKKHGRDTVIFSFAMLSLYVLVTQIVLLIEPVESSIAVRESLSVVLDANFRILTASFLGFWISQTILVRLAWGVYQRANVYVAALIGALAVHTIDAFIFFPIAFGGVLPVEEVIGLMKDGFIVKMAIALISIPFFSIVTKTRDQRIPSMVE